MKEDVVMFAQALSVRLGAGARPYALDYADRLREVGDEEGYRVWVQVAAMMDDQAIRDVA